MYFLNKFLAAPSYDVYIPFPIEKQGTNSDFANKFTEYSTFSNRQYVFFPAINGLYLILFSLYFCCKVYDNTVLPFASLKLIYYVYS